MFIHFFPLLLWDRVYFVKITFWFWLTTYLLWLVDVFQQTGLWVPTVFPFSWTCSFNRTRQILYNYKGLLKKTVLRRTEMIRLETYACTYYSRSWDEWAPESSERNQPWCDEWINRRINDISFGHCIKEWFWFYTTTNSIQYCSSTVPFWYDLS